MKSSTAIVLFLLLSVGCSSQTITRAKAKELLEHRAPATVEVISPTPEELAAGLQKGLWVRTDSYKATALLDNCMVFTDAHGTLSSGAYYGSRGSKFGIRVVEITGISDASTLFGPAGKVKIVHFRYLWDFAGCPDVVRTVFTTPMKHNSLLELYDDGWRLEAWSGELLN